MNTKTNNIIYWIATIIFSGLMVYSSLGGIQLADDAVKLMHDQLGFPVYCIQFISIAKVLGSIAILIPGLNRSLKDWAYAGLFFDLTGAIYAGIATSPAFDPRMFGMLIWIVPGILSYYFWQKKMNK